MTAVLYRAHLVDGTTKRVKVTTMPTAVYVEGDRYTCDPAEAVAAYGRSRGWTVVGVTAPQGAR